jgi:hypothetical protein
LFIIQALYLVNGKLIDPAEATKHLANGKRILKSPNIMRMPPLPVEELNKARHIPSLHPTTDDPNLVFPVHQVTAVQDDKN